MPTAEANGITINYLLSGPENGEFVVLVNGLADDLTTWELQATDLVSAGYRVLRYDNRGIGKTSRPPGPYTSVMLADDLHGLLRTLDVKSMHLLGISMGGMIAQSYALKYPNGSPAAQGVEMLSLSLCCTYMQPTNFCSKMFEWWADVAQKMSVQDVMRDVLLWAFTVPFFRTRTEEVKEFEEGMRQLDMSTEEYLAQLNVIQKFDTSHELDRLKAAEQTLGGLEPRKIMVLAGKVDMLIPVQLSKELAEKIEGSHFITTKGGHACCWEFPADFNRCVLDFLKATTSTPHGPQ